MRLFVIAALFLALPGVAVAQGMDGSDRPGNWRVKVFETHGIWSTICDERHENGELRQRCYIRYVDVFSPRPDFAAMFLFVTPDAGNARVEFGLETGTLFDPNGFRIEREGRPVWAAARPGCLVGLRCVFDGAQGSGLVKHMISGGAFRFAFRDRHGTARDLTWPLDGFAQAYAAYRKHASERGLIEVLR